MANIFRLVQPRCAARHTKQAVYFLMRARLGFGWPGSSLPRWGEASCFQPHFQVVTKACSMSASGHKRTWWL
jgi:hypothetical protein